MRAVYVAGCDKWVSLSAYLAAVKQAKAHPDAEFKHGLTCWGPCKGRDIMRQFFDGLTDRINQGIPYANRGMDC